MITHTFKMELDNGIIVVTVRTEEKWVNYQINRLPEPAGIQISFFDTKEVETMPGQWEDEETEISEVVKMGSGFDVFDYVVTSSQEKDEITIVLIPEEIVRGKFSGELEFETLGTYIS